jgi:hypothetical protein
MDRNTHAMVSPHALALTVPAALLALGRGTREGLGTMGDVTSDRRFNFRRS